LNLQSFYAKRILDGFAAGVVYPLYRFSKNRAFLYNKIQFLVQLG